MALCLVAEIPREGGEAMAEHYREGDSELVGHAKAADGALNFLKNWIGVIALLIGIGWEAERIVGKVESAETESNRRFGSIEKSMDDFKAEVRDKLKSTGADATTATSDAKELKGKLDAMGDRVKRVEDSQTTQDKAYNMNFTTRLARIEARLGIQGKQGD